MLVVRRGPTLPTGSPLENARSERPARGHPVVLTTGDLDAGTGTGEHLTMDQIAAIPCPVTCLLGDLTTPAIANATQRITEALPNARLVEIKGAGHAIHFDQPHAFVDAVLAAAGSAPR